MMLLLTGQPPFAPGDPAATLQQVLQGEIDPAQPPRRRAHARDRSRRAQGDGQEPEPAPADHAPVPHRRDRAGRAGRGAGRRQATAGVGFAKTMLFSGGSPEVQKLVNQAVAARAQWQQQRHRAACGMPVAAAPSASAADSGVTPPPTARGACGRRRAARTARRSRPPWSRSPPPSCPDPPVSTAPGSSASAGAFRGDSGPVAATPPPVAFTPPPQQMPAAAAGGPAPSPKPAAGGTFRETLWFKKGDVDQMVADARARVEAAKAKGVAGRRAGGAGGAGRRGEAARRALRRRRLGHGRGPQEVLAAFGRHVDRAADGGQRRRRPGRPDERFGDGRPDRRRQAHADHRRRRRASRWPSA